MTKPNSRQSKSLTRSAKVGGTVWKETRPKGEKASMARKGMMRDYGQYLTDVKIGGPLPKELSPKKGRKVIKRANLEVKARTKAKLKAQGNKAQSSPSMGFNKTGNRKVR
jgi:hypothetical protein